MSDQLEFRCPHCEQLYRLGADQLARYAGRVTHCRKCHQAFTFPELTADEPQQQEAAQEQSVQEQADQEEAEAGGTRVMAAQVGSDVAVAEPQVRVSEIPRPSFVPPTVSLPSAPVRTQPPAGGGDYLAFGRTGARGLAILLFWAGSVFCVAGGLALLAASLRAPGAMDVLAIIKGAALIVLGPLALRLLGELLVLLERIDRHGGGSAGQ